VSLSLPIYAVEQELIAGLRERGRLVLTAPTGAGKSTQVPQMLLRHGFLERGQAAVLEPRRIAARLLAARAAAELGVPLGHEVGYQVRFENRTGPSTRIRYVTEGILLRQMLEDPKLSGVSALIVDEFHERHLYGDVLLAWALGLQAQARPDLLLVVMSATLEDAPLEKYLQPCARVSSTGRAHPVRISYRGAVGDPPIWEQVAQAFCAHVHRGGQGDVLVFLPGGYEIFRTQEELGKCKESRGYLLLPLHGELAPQDQDAAVARYSEPKIVLATNVAETSITIDGIRLVIDSGLARIPRYDPYRGVNTLFTEKISRASADQRTGRAGRTAPGECVRLWTPEDQAHRPAREAAEVKRLELSEVILSLKAAGVPDLRSFPWYEPPTHEALDHAETLLTELGALKDGSLTALGRRMAAFPLHPRYARMLLAAQDLGCVREAAQAAALTQGRDLLLRNVDARTSAFREEHFGGPSSSDFQVLLGAWEFAEKNEFRQEPCRRAGIHAGAARQVRPLVDQFLRLAERSGLDVAARASGDEALRKCILLGFSDRVARRSEPGTLRCEVVHGRKGVLVRESAVRQSPLFVAAEVREVEGKGQNAKTLLSLATAIEVDWLVELFPEDISRRNQVFFDPSAKRVMAEEWLRFRDLVLEKRRLEPPPAPEAARLLAEEVLSGRLKLADWDASVDQWWLRMGLLSRACPELGIPSASPADRREILEKVCRGAVATKDVKDRPVKASIREWLGGERTALVERHAPERLALPNGRSAKLVYVADGAPHLALRIQELYGVREVPRIARGRVAPLVRILAPSMRPVQITQDLVGFWRDHYPSLRRELKRKYPKHDWRENP
jgi:ATP-dependent helicase HrpB